MDIRIKDLRRRSDRGPTVQPPKAPPTPQPFLQDGVPGDLAGQDHARFEGPRIRAQADNLRRQGSEVGWICVPGSTTRCIQVFICLSFPLGVGGRGGEGVALVDLPLGSSHFATFPENPSSAKFWLQARRVKMLPLLHGGSWDAFCLFFPNS